jgi:signal transduction histidine kinase
MEQIVRWHLKRARATAAGLDATAQAAVGPVLQDVALVLGPEARRRDVVLEITAHDAPDFRGDPEDLAEIIGTLAENAVKWAQASVRIVAQPESGNLEISVTDDGPGIPEAERARLLTRGARLDESMPGHGLGLAIVADRVAAYGGKLDLEQARGGGLRATVTLPARA